MGEIRDGGLDGLCMALICGSYFFSIYRYSLIYVSEFSVVS